MLFLPIETARIQKARTAQPRYCSASPHDSASQQRTTWLNSLTDGEGNLTRKEVVLMSTIRAFEFDDETCTWQETVLDSYSTPAELEFLEAMKGESQ